MTTKEPQPPPSLIDRVQNEIDALKELEKIGVPRELTDRVFKQWLKRILNPPTSPPAPKKKGGYRA